VEKKVVNLMEYGIKAEVAGYFVVVAVDQRAKYQSF